MGPGGMTIGADLVEIDAIKKYLYEDLDRHGNVRLYFRKRVGGQAQSADRSL
jgi:hypothetical protein